MGRPHQQLRPVHHTPCGCRGQPGAGQFTVRSAARRSARRSRRAPEGTRRLPLAARATCYLPVPFSEALTDAGRLVPSPVTVTVPLEVTTAVGAYRTWMLHVLPAARTVPTQPVPLFTTVKTLVADPVVDAVAALTRNEI